LLNRQDSGEKNQDQSAEMSYYRQDIDDHGCTTSWFARSEYQANAGDYGSQGQGSNQRPDDDFGSHSCQREQYEAGIADSKEKKHNCGD
jgi:hypothetical protein